MYERVALAAATGLVAFLVSGMFLSIELNKPLWILVGLALALEVVTRDLLPVAAVERALGSHGLGRSSPDRSSHATNGPRH